MLSNFSSNAILSKARAMYGKRLKKEDYRELLNCKSVSEVAGYLKSHTAYGKILAGVNENEVHRGQLESKLRQKLFEDYASLCRYEISVGEHFAQYLLERSEIEQILHSLMYLGAGMPEEYLFSLPSYLNRHTRIDLYALSHVQSYDDLLDALSHTPYRKLMEPFRPVAGVPLNYTGIENALYTYLYDSAFTVIRKYTHGETSRQLREIFETYIDLINVTRIIRLKTAYHESPDFVRSTLLPFGTIKPRLLEEMLEADAGDVLDVMAKSSIGKRCQKIEHTYIDQIPDRVKYSTCRHDIRFSTHPSVVMISYIFLTQIELQDIINIVEGIRYQLAPDEIKKLLTVADYL
ncbi:V-type ATPase subunit [Clostridium sp. D33t1_170424_F3]|uniref:V0D/AC39 family V-type ATPase subunit n=1 Tax=Clostridium sp. D33t1_170424_F3 TaxID=2787099 RepID=UPI0018AAEDD9|nr:V-type ATPase subunit [Clostridium sp. D33t1_170424_F3]